MAVEEDKTLGVHAFASKARVCFQSGAGYAIGKVLPKAKVVLPYLLAYYVFPTIVSLVYTLLTQRYTIHHMYVDTQNLSDVEVCVELPTLVAPGGTLIRNMKVKVGFGESDVHACTLVSHSLHEWKHLQKVRVRETMAILHNEEFDAEDITVFMRERKNAWILLELDLGVNLLLGSIYFRMSFKKSIGIFGKQDAKVLDIVSGTATEEDDVISAAVKVRPRVPEFLRFFAPKFSMEACGMIGGADAEARRLYVVSVEPLQWTEPDTTVSCTVRSERADIENIKDMVQSQERRTEKVAMVFRPLDTGAFSACSRKYIDAALRGIVVEPEDTNNAERRREIEVPLIRISIGRITPDDVRGIVSVHRTLFPNDYIYELARNIKYENCSGRVDLDEVKIADGYLHNRVDHPDQYVSCEFWGEIHNWTMLICRVLHPDGQVLSMGTDGAQSLLSYFLNVWKVLVDFRKGIQATSLGCMQPRPPVERPEGVKNNIINIHSRVVEDEGTLLRLAATVHTEDYRARPFAMLEFSEDQFFVIPNSHIQTSIDIKRCEVVFNIEESIGRVVSIGRPAEIDVVFEKLDEFSGIDRSYSTTAESIYNLLVFLLCGERRTGHTFIEKVLEEFVKSSCTGHTIGTKKASVMLQEVLGYDRYKVLFTFQGDALEDALVNIELCAPSAELSMFPIQHGQMSRMAFVRTEIQPFALRVQAGRRSIALQETETTLLLSIFVKFSADLMARRFTFMYSNKETLFSCMLNFCMNFFQGSLDMLGSVKHEGRGYESIKHFTSAVPKAKLDVDVHMDERESVCAKLQIGSGSGGGSAFSIDTENIRIRAVGLESEKNNPPSSEDVVEVLRVDVSPLGINLRQKNNHNFCQRGLDISVWVKMCILYCNQYEVSIEYGEKNAGNLTPPLGKFILANTDVIAILSFLNGFYSEPSEQKKEAENQSVLWRVIGAMRSLIVKPEVKKKDEDSRARDAVSRMFFVGHGLGEAFTEGRRRRQQIVDVRCSYDFLRANKIIGSIAKRINLERYPQTLSMRTKLRIVDASKKERALSYEMVVDDFPITYQDSYLRRCEDTFRMRLLYPVENKLMLKTPSCGSNKTSVHSLISGTGVCDKIFNYDHMQNMYFTVTDIGFRANMDLCIEVYSDNKMSLKFSTAACIHKGGITILPLFIVPLNFNKKQLNLLVKVYVNTTLLHSLEVETEIQQGLLGAVPKCMIKNPFWNLEGWVFSKNQEYEIDKKEFEAKFTTLRTPIS